MEAEPCGGDPLPQPRARPGRDRGGRGSGRSVFRRRPTRRSELNHVRRSAKSRSPIRSALGMELLKRLRELVAELLDRPVGDQPAHLAVLACLLRQPLLLEMTALLVLAAAAARARCVPGGLRHHPERYEQQRTAPRRCRQARSLQSAAIVAMSGSDLQHRLDRALREVERLRAENERLRTLLALAQQTKTILDPSKPEPRPTAPARPASAEREGRARPAPVPRPRRRLRASLGERPHRQERLCASDRGGLELGTARRRICRSSDEAIERHLRGRESIGVYPLLEDDTLLVPRLRPGRQRRGSSMRSRCSRHATSTECRRRWSEAARERAATSGSSSPLRSRPSAARRLGALLLRASDDAGAESSTSQATTGSSLTRTSCPRRGSAT